MESSYEEIDVLNDETFGAAEIGDWEAEHQRLARLSTPDLSDWQDSDAPADAPGAHQLPSFWSVPKDPPTSDSWRVTTTSDASVKDKSFDLEQNLTGLLQELNVSEPYKNNHSRPWSIDDSLTKDLFSRHATPTPSLQDPSPFPHHNLFSPNPVWGNRQSDTTNSGSLALLDSFDDDSDSLKMPGSSRVGQFVFRDDDDTSRGTTPVPRQTPLQPSYAYRHQNSLRSLQSLHATAASPYNHSLQSQMLPKMTPPGLSNRAQLSNSCQLNPQWMTSAFTTGGGDRPPSNLVNQRNRHPLQSQPPLPPPLNMDLVNAAFRSNNPALVQQLLLLQQQQHQQQFRHHQQTRFPGPTSNFSFPPPTSSSNHFHPVNNNSARNLQQSSSPSPYANALTTRQSFDHRSPAFSSSTYSTRSSRLAPCHSLALAGGWMSEYTMVGCLDLLTRVFAFSNPYIHEYYYTVKQLPQLKGNLDDLGHSSSPHDLPLPIGEQDLILPSFYHNFALREFLVASLHHVTRERQAPASANGTGESFDQARFRVSRQTNLFTRQLFTMQLSMRDLGRDDDKSLVETSPLRLDGVEGDDKSSIPLSTQVKQNRQRRWLLARIERGSPNPMTFECNQLDLRCLLRDFDSSSMQSGLNRHLVLLTQRLVDEFGLTSSDDDLDDSFHLLTDLLTVRKGAGLLTKLLSFLPLNVLQRAWFHLLTKFDLIITNLPGTENEFATIVLPSMLRSTRRLTSVESLISTTFLVRGAVNLTTLFSSKLGFTLVLCLLDRCACLSDPDRPFTFTKLASLCIDTVAKLPNDQLPATLEPFPQLSDILHIYLSNTPSDQLDVFCSLLKCRRDDDSTGNVTPTNEEEGVEEHDNLPSLATSIHLSPSSPSTCRLLQPAIN